MKEGIERQVEGYIEQVGLYSKEHRDYLDKLNRLLDEMKDSGNLAERQHYNSFRETVTAFEKYVSTRQIELTRKEKERFGIIASSGLGSLAKKRMAEDLMRSVKERYSSESEIKLEEGRRKKEIEGLSRSHFFFVNWYRLFRFALDYNTITLISHLYKASSLDVIRVNTVEWYRKVEDEIFRILDEYYYYLSTLEYNSLVKLAEAGNAAERLNELKKMTSYEPAELFEFMEDFSSRFICVMNNLSVIDRALKKVFKDRQPAHGFRGYIGLLTDRPLQNNVVIRLKGRSMMRNSICGALYSFYTSHFGVRVLTFNQLMHLAAEDGIIDTAKKNLTQGAIRRLNEEEKKRETDDYKIRARLDQIFPLTEKYAGQGASLAERIFNMEKPAGHSASKEQYRPLLRIVKILEGYIKYFIEPVAAGSAFNVEYENEKVDISIGKYPELLKAAEDFIILGEELQGSRGRDVAGFRVPLNDEGSSLVQKLADAEEDLPKVEGAKSMRGVLSAISSKSFNICMRFNDIIIKYNTAGRTEPPDYTDKFDFAVNSRIQHSRIRTLEILLAKKDISLMDFIEAGCSLGFYLADFFGHKGIKAIYDETGELKENLLGKNSGSADDADKSGATANTAGKSDIAEEMDVVYTDTLTGFRKWEYFEDFILPVYYDEKKCYNGDAVRHVFCCEISNLYEINHQTGKDAGDLVYKKFADVINSILLESGTENAAFRSGGGIITGFLTGMSQTAAADLLHRILKGVVTISADEGGVQFGEVLFNAGLYREWKGSDVYKNIEVAEKIMKQVEDGVGSHLGFVRSQDYVVTEKDFDRRGCLREGMISVIV